VNPTSSELSEVPLEYLQFVDMFDKQHAKLLPKHCPFNLTIQIAKSYIVFKFLALLALDNRGMVYSLMYIDSSTPGC